jgi:AAA domain
MRERDDYTVEHLEPVALCGSNKPARNRAPCIRSARELCQRKFEPIKYVVPGYVAEGCTLLAGRPKLGKSWLVLEMGLAVACGSHCLGGIDCDQGDVLYLALEDNERRLQSRIRKLLDRAEEWSERFHYATEWPRAEEGLAAIRNWIKCVERPRLVILDVLAMYRATAGRNDNQYEADYNAIKGLQALAGEYGIAIVIVHHTRKAGSDVDPFEKVSGTLGLSGAADTTIILDTDGSGATIYARGRDIEQIESAVEFDKPTCRWRVQGVAAEVRRSDERSVILALLEDAPELLSPSDLAALTGKKSGAIRKLLHLMMKSGEVRKTKRGKYLHPSRADLVTEADPLTPGNNGNKVISLDAYRRVRDGEDLE